MYNIFNTLDKYADEYEPYAASVALGSIPISFFGPYGMALTVAGLVPGAIIDGYQAARSWYKHFNDKDNDKDNKHLNDALWNTTEFLLDIGGSNISKGIIRNGTKLISKKPKLIKYPKPTKAHSKPLVPNRDRLIEQYLAQEKKYYNDAKRILIDKYGKNPTKYQIRQQMDWLKKLDQSIALSNISINAANNALKISPILENTAFLIPNIIDIIQGINKK